MIFDTGGACFVSLVRKLAQVREPARTSCGAIGGQDFYTSAGASCCEQIVFVSKVPRLIRPVVCWRRLKLGLSFRPTLSRYSIPSAAMIGDTGCEKYLRTNGGHDAATNPPFSRRSPHMAWAWRCLSSGVSQEVRARVSMFISWLSVFYPASSNLALILRTISKLAFHIAVLRSNKQLLDQ